MQRAGIGLGVWMAAVALAGALLSAQVDVKPIAPPAAPLPTEAASEGVSKFSFIAYGDTRSGASPSDAEVLHPEHTKVMDRMLASIRELSTSAFPVRFVLQSGDAVLRGATAEMWNVGFSPIVERLTRDANIPYFFTVGNHDVTTQPLGDPQRTLGLRNTLTAMAHLIPPEGSPRRLDGYPTYAFGYGNTFAIAFDSNVASDTAQLAWVTSQLEHLDRARYRHVIAFFHHPVFSSGPHGGTQDKVEGSTAALRSLYMPLFRKHHVDLLITGHDHLFDHWIERYEDGGRAYRMDAIVSGGGGAPVYSYAGEPDLTAYVADASAAKVQVQHLTKPGTTADENPHHFVVVRVDGDRLSVEVIAIGDTPFTPYPGGLSRIVLTDKKSTS